jgi:prepilin-type processing-associated H-X9-DG protein
MTMRRGGLIVRWVIIALAVVAVPLLVSVFVRRGNEANLPDRCTDRLSALSFAILGYRDSHSGLYPPGTASNSSLLPERRLSWITLLYKYFDESQNINFLFDTSVRWDASVNRVPRIRSLDFDTSGKATYSDYSPPRLHWFHVLLCPAINQGADSGVTNYVGISGVGSDSPTFPMGHPRAGVFGYNRQTSVADIKDGLACTVMVAETAGGIGPWIAGGPPTVRGLDSGRRPYVGLGRQFGGSHPGGAMIALADGSVRFLRGSIDPTIFEALSTIAGWEVMPARWDQ